MGMSAGGASSGRSGSGRAANRMVLSEINVTPLVDVMLVLLIIFMVTTPLIKEGVEIDVPDVTAAAIEQSEEQLTLAIKKNRAIYIGNTEVALDELEDKLKHNALIQAKGAMYLEADQGLPYGFVVEVMTIARRAGVRDLGLVTEPPRALE